MEGTHRSGVGRCRSCRGGLLFFNSHRKDLPAASAELFLSFVAKMAHPEELVLLFLLLSCSWEFFHTQWVLQVSSAVIPLLPWARTSMGPTLRAVDICKVAALARQSRSGYLVAPMC